jgi:diguanylate cyclase (GGDEF)-like protein
MCLIALICSMALSLILAILHRALTTLISTDITDLIMFSISTITLLIFSALITLKMKNEQELERLKNHFEEVSVRDPLTNLYNRRFLVKELARLRKHVQRDLRNSKTSSLVLIFMDMDDLKKINDNYGHQTGDGALCTTATIISNEIRDRDGEDFLGRYGGDEFCAAIVISDYCSIHELLKRTAKITHRIHKTMRKAIFFHGAKRIPLSLTIGMHIMDLDEPNSMTELAKADAKMLEKKQRRKTGRSS